MKYNINLKSNINIARRDIHTVNQDISETNIKIINLQKYLKNLEIKKKKLEDKISNVKLSPAQLETIKYFNETAPKLKLNDKYLVSVKSSTYAIAIVKYNELFKTNMLYYNGKYIIQSKNVLDTIERLFTYDWNSDNSGITISPDINVYKDNWSKNKQLRSRSCSKYRLGNEYKKIINLKSPKFTFSTNTIESNLKSKDKTVKKMIKTVLNNIVYDK